MNLVNVLASTNNLSLSEWLKLIPWGELSGFLATIASIYAFTLFVAKNMKKLLNPYKAYIEDIDAVLGEESRKLIEKYYIPTRGQDVDPCNEEEIRENNGQYNTKYLIQFLCDEAFSDKSFGKHYLILADSGMGKTTFLVNLYRHYVLKTSFWSKDKKCMRYIPLSSDNCLDQIRSIDNAGETILLLDALDENRDAINDSSTFVKELLKNTNEFHKIVITCRTHFFSDKESEPDNTGLIQAGTGNKNVRFTKKYITPFSDDEVKKYLKKRFRFQFGVQRKAKEIVYTVPDVMARPLILNWIDCLVESDKKLVYRYEIYETIIMRWVKREPEVYTKGKLLELSCRIAQWMMIHSTTHIPASEVERMACMEDIELLPIIAKSRSLLNRNSNGEYKFAHRSFLEFFLATMVYLTAKLPKNDNFLHRMSGFRIFFDEYLQRSLFHNKNDELFREECGDFLAAQKALNDKYDLLEAFTTSTVRLYSVASGELLDFGKCLHIKVAFIRKHLLFGLNSILPCVVCSFAVRAFEEKESGNARLIEAKEYWVNRAALNSDVLSNEIDISTNVYHSNWEFLP